MSNATKELKRDAERDLARLARESAELLQRLQDLEVRIDALTELGDPDDEQVGELVRELQGEYRKLLQSPEHATAIAEHLLRADEEHERVKVECQVRELRARRTRDRAWKVLWPAMCAWAEHQPRARGTKTIRLPGTTARLTGRATKASVEIVEPYRVLEWIKAELGAFEAVSKGVLKVKEEASRTGLLALIEETGELPPGIEYEPAGEKLGLYRR